MAKLAELVEILQMSGTYSLKIDGEEFPFYIAENGLTVQVGSRTSAPTVTIVLLAETISVETSLNPQPEEMTT